MKPDDIKAAALAMSDQGRASLARDLIDSLDPQDQRVDGDDWAAAWGAEIASRLAKYEANGEAIPHEQVMAEARARLNTLRG